MRFSEFVWSADDIITTDKYKMHVDGLAGAVYMKTDLLYHGPMVWRGAEHRIRDARLWVTGHSDYEVSDAVVAAAEGRFESWFSVNMNCERVTALPLGITNCTDESPLHSIYGDIGLMMAAGAARPPRKNLVYMNFAVGTHQSRLAIHARFSGLPWVTVEEPRNSLEGRAAYLAALREHAFSICPRGNGIDTHRVWESLYMGCIPIVLRERLFESFPLPILIVDDWSEVTEKFLRAKHDEIHNGDWDMEALRVKYWLAKIDAAAAS
jgi:hypothetical protein